MRLFLGTGRCGTLAFARCFSGHHEYGVKNIRSYFSTRYEKYPFNTIEKKEMALRLLFEGVESYDLFIDADNTLNHFVDEIYKRYSDVKFVLLIRDGRDFAVSAANRNWHNYNVLDHLPLSDDLYYDRWKDMSPIERCAWMWVDRNTRALQNLSIVPEDKKMIVRIEDCGVSKIEDIGSFLNISANHVEKITSKNEHSNLKNGNFSYHNSWDQETLYKFDLIAKKMMTQFGYYGRS